MLANCKKNENSVGTSHLSKIDFPHASKDSITFQVYAFKHLYPKIREANNGTYGGGLFYHELQGILALLFYTVIQTHWDHFRSLSSCFPYGSQTNWRDKKLNYIFSGAWMHELKLHWAQEFFHVISDELRQKRWENLCNWHGYKCYYPKVYDS